MQKPSLANALIRVSLMLLLLAVLSGCGSSSSSQGTNQPVNQNRTINNLHQLDLAFIQYTQDNDEKLPVAQNMQELIPLLMPFSRNSSIYVDPNTNMLLGWNASLSGTTLTLYPDVSKIVTFYDVTPPIAEARPICLLDGDVELVSDAQWQGLKASSHIP